MQNLSIIATSTERDDVAIPASSNIERASYRLVSPGASNSTAAYLALVESSDLLLRSCTLGLSLATPRYGTKPSQHPSIAIGKRSFDILASVAALVVFLPVLIVCAVAILLESGGPVFFRQSRLGLRGTPFSIVKFRTMVQDAESVLERHLQSNPAARREWEADQKLRDDPRVLWIGKFVRKFSLDELPQLWNVLRGDMSLVGPRPIVSKEIQRYREAFREYCKVRPGITGLWQVSGRNDTGYAERVALDCTYVSQWSFLLDVGIIIKTLSVVIKAAGAY